MAANDTDHTRFSLYTAWNHQAPLWVVTILSLIYSSIFLLARLAAKYKSLGLDDAILGLAYVCSPSNQSLTQTADSRSIAGWSCTMDRHISGLTFGCWQNCDQFVPTIDRICPPCECQLIG